MDKATIARGLLSIGAVFLRPQEPFIWASGIWIRKQGLQRSF